MKEKFIVNLPKMWHEPWPDYFTNFWSHCQDVAAANDWMNITVVNYKLKPYGGKLIQTKTQGWYLRWDEEASHTAFVLKWS